MTKKKRITAGILAAVAAVLLGNTTVMAAAQAGEPVFSIETDQTEYSSTDPINETIKIYNASDDILTDIEISGNIPDGYLTEDGISSPEQWKAQIENVDVGETRESTVILVRKISGAEQEKPDTEIPALKTAVCLISRAEAGRKIQEQCRQEIQPILFPGVSQVRQVCVLLLL